MKLKSDFILAIGIVILCCVVLSTGLTSLPANQKKEKVKKQTKKRFEYQDRYDLGREYGFHFKDKKTGEEYMLFEYYYIKLGQEEKKK